MRTIFFVLTATILSGSAFAQDWIDLASSDAGFWEGRAGTMDFATTKGGIPIATASGRIRWTKDKSVDFVRWYVAVDHCKKGYGKLVTLNMSGEFKYENDYVKNGGSIASSIGDVLCSGVEQRDLKGI